MAHSTITPTDADRYYAGDAIDLPFTVQDHSAGTVIDLTGMSVEFRLKESLTDTDSNALITKTGTEGGATDGVTFTDALNGSVKININTGDTSNVVDDVDTDPVTRLESVIIEWHFRVIDTNGARVTSETGEWEVFSS